ncbi:MAG: hypothetical protein HY657_05500 [Acidobacteria bacterium]|nr:hypothetical protein [Acidobacteriota bacterium]
MRRARLVRSSLALVLGTLACLAWGCGGSEDGDGPTGPSPAPREVWNIHFGTPGNGLDVSPCGVSVAGGFCGQPIRVDAHGAFSEVWSESTPNTLRAEAP